MTAVASLFRDIEALVEASAKKDPRSFLLPVTVLGKMEEGGVRPSEIERIVGQSATQRDERHAGMLSIEASEKAARLAHIVGLAQKVFGADEKAFFWLRAPNAQLGGATPIDCIQRESGGRLVEDILIRIDHGIAA